MGAVKPGVRVRDFAVKSLQTGWKALLLVNLLLAECVQASDLGTCIACPKTPDGNVTLIREGDCQCESSRWVPQQCEITRKYLESIFSETPSAKRRRDFKTQIEKEPTRSIAIC